jgi:hypothetical protein
MTVRTKSRAKTRQPRRILVWGSATRDKGLAIEHFGRSRENGTYWWNVLHLKDGKVVFVHRDYPSRAKTLREAQDYAKHEKAHLRNCFIR